MANTRKGKGKFSQQLHSASPLEEDLQDEIQPVISPAPPSPTPPPAGPSSTPPAVSPTVRSPVPTKVESPKTPASIPDLRLHNENLTAPSPVFEQVFTDFARANAVTHNRISASMDALAQTIQQFQQLAALTLGVNAPQPVAPAPAPPVAPAPPPEPAPRPPPRFTTQPVANPGATAAPVVTRAPAPPPEPSPSPSAPSSIAGDPPRPPSPPSPARRSPPGYRPERRDHRREDTSPIRTYRIPRHYSSDFPARPRPSRVLQDLPHNYRDDRFPNLPRTNTFQPTQYDRDSSEYYSPPGYRSPPRRSAVDPHFRVVDPTRPLGLQEKEIESARRYLSSANADRPKPYGENGVDIVSFRQFQLQVIDYLQAYAGRMPDFLAVACIRGLLRGELRSIAEGLLRNTPNIRQDALWNSLLLSQPRQAREFPRLLVQTAAAIELVPSSNPAIAHDNLSQFIAKFSDLGRLAQPITDAERNGLLSIVLPRPEELVRPFLDTLDRACQLGDQVNTILLANPDNPVSLPHVLNLTRRAALEKPSKLLPAHAPKARFAYADPTPVSHLQEYNDHVYPDDISPHPDAALLAFQQNNSRRPTGGRPFQRRPPRPLRPGEPSYDPSVRCVYCALRYPDKPNAGVGHRTEWCLQITGEYDPKKPTVNALPASPSRIAAAIIDAQKWGQLGQEAAARSANLPSPGPSAELHAAVAAPAFDFPEDDAQFSSDASPSENGLASV
jgi:hypothetical protein